MKRTTIFIFSLILFLGCNSPSGNKVDDFPILTGKYLGQIEPGNTPEIFAPNIISTGMAEINAVFSPDYKEFYYTIRMPNRQLVIMVLKNNGSVWTQPEVAPFSGEYPDADPFISNDGKWLYFVSKRPIDSLLTIKNDWDIWRMHKVGENWSEPERLDDGINSEADDIYPTLTKHGTLYYSSGRFGKNNRDVFYAKSNGSEFESSIKLNDTINSHWEGDIYVSPEEDYMIFASYGRKEGSGLYISFNSNGQWNLPQRMNKEINMTGREYCPIISPDGKYFFFTSAYTKPSLDLSNKLTYDIIKEKFIESYNFPQQGKSDIYWVKSDIINNYRNK